MHNRVAYYLITVHFLVVPGVAQQNHFATSKKNMVATVHPIATDAGLNAFKKGGNAVDAAIAAAVTLGVVDGYNSGLGGGCFILIRKSDGKIVAIDGREMAPGAAKRNMFLKDGVPVEDASQVGALAIGVPGAVAAYAEAIAKHGSLRFDETLKPAAKIAESGFKISKVYASKLRSHQEKLKLFPETARILLDSGGNAWQEGHLLIQKDLAKSYRMIAERGVDWFYKGPFAERTEEWMEENGGIITKEDFRNYRTISRTPIKTTYRRFEIVGFPPPSSGGVHVAQILNILESFNLAKIKSDDPARFYHIVAEAMKLAFADRAHWLGDPDFVKVPKQLVSKYYARELSSKIDQNQTTRVDYHGDPPLAQFDFFGKKHTTHLTAADAEGNWVAITTTINTTFGSKVIIPGTGIVMNNQMDDFSIAPGVPNAYGLVGSENNSIKPGKRPLSSMSPTIVTKEGRPVFSVGAAGGPKIISQALMAIVNHVELSMPVPEAVAQARIHHQWSPDILMVEETLPKSVCERLRGFGHEIKVVPSEQMGVSQAIGFDVAEQMFVGVFDSRIPGKAAGE